MTPNPKHSLSYRLYQAFNAVGDLEKKGTNVTGEYDYLRASDVARAFRKEFKKRHIFLTSDEISVSGRTLTTPGGPMTMVTVKLNIYFHCALTGEVIGPRCAIGQAMDINDKGIWKAKTGAVKSFLRVCSLVPDKEEPEADETVDQHTKPGNGKAATPPRQSAPKPYRERHPEQPLDLHQAKAITDGLRATEQTEEQFCAHFQVDGIRGLKRERFQEALRWALTPQPTVEAKKENGKAQPIVEILDRVADDEVAI